jgi:hypothetical protein
VIRRPTITSQVIDVLRRTSDGAFRRLASGGAVDREVIMSDVQQLIDDYFTMWNEDDPERCVAAASKVFVEDATYTDPLAEVVGPRAIAEMVGALRQSHAGYRLRLASTIDEHHDRLRFEWEILDADGDSYLIGVDCATVADGRLTSLSGFFGAAPERLAA